MNNIIIIFISFILNISYCQNISFQIKDKLTNKNIEYVSINLMNGNGFFSNKEGIVNGDFTNIESIEISHISYIKKNLNVKEIREIIYLEPNIIEMKEVIILQKKNKKYYNYKIQNNGKHNTFSHFGTYGYQLAIPLNINNIINKDCFLDKVVIPIKIDKMYMTRNNKDINLLSLISIGFYENIDNLPSEKIESELDFIFIDKKTLKNEIIEYNLKEKIKVPNNGLYCVITFLGITDDKGNLISENPHWMSNYKGKDIMFTKSVPLQIPLKIDEKLNLTYSRSVFSEELIFEKVHPPISIPIEVKKEKQKFFYKNILDNLENFKVDIGYTLFYYE